VKPRPEDAVISYNKSDLDDIGSVRKATPTVQDIAASCGATVREEINRFGRREVVAEVPARAAFEAMRPAWRKDTDRLGEREAKRLKTVLRDKNGHERKVDSFAAESVAKANGLYEKWSGKATHVYRHGRWWRVVGDHLEPDNREGRMAEILESRQAPKTVIH